MEGPVNTYQLDEREARRTRRFAVRASLLRRVAQEREVLTAEVERLRRENAELTARVAIDPLTGVGSRAAWDDALRAEELHLGRSGGPCSVVVIDLDTLKEINDEVGHGAGDDLLRRCGALLRGAIRATDLVARIGGDEFAVLLRYTDADQAKVWCARLEEARRELDDPMLRISLGRASAPPSGNLAEAVHEADRQMYKEKRLRRSARRAAARA